MLHIPFGLCARFAEVLHIPFGLRAGFAQVLRQPFGLHAGVAADSSSTTVSYTHLTLPTKA